MVKVEKIWDFNGDVKEFSLEEIIWNCYVEDLNWVEYIDGFVFNYGFDNVRDYDVSRHKYVILNSAYNIAFARVDKGIVKRWVKYDLRSHKACFVDCMDDSDCFYLPVRMMSSIVSDRVLGYIKKAVKGVV